MLRQVEEKDLEWIRKERNRPENNKWFRQDGDITPEEQKKWFEAVPKHVFVIDDNKGTVALSRFDTKARKCEFSIMVSPEHRGKGYATEAMKKILSYAFDVLKMNMVYSDVFLGNPALELFLKLGFRKYGLLPHWYYKDGKYITSAVIAITQDEYSRFK